MSYLFSCQGLAKAFGAQTLFTDIGLVINPGDRIGLTGPNGSGKSTLLKIICGLEHEDSGTIIRRRQCTISYLAQEDSFQENSSLVENLLAVLETLPVEEAEKVSRGSGDIEPGRFRRPKRIRQPAVRRLEKTACRVPRAGQRTRSAGHG